MQGRHGEAACQGAVKSRFCAFYTTSNVTESSVSDLSSCPLILSSVFTRHAIFSWKSSFCFRNEGGWVPLPRRNSSGQGPGRGAGSGEAGWSPRGQQPGGQHGPCRPGTAAWGGRGLTDKQLPAPRRRRESAVAVPGPVPARSQPCSPAAPDAGLGPTPARPDPSWRGQREGKAGAHVCPGPVAAREVAAASAAA